MTTDNYRRVSLDRPENVLSFPGAGGQNTGIVGYSAQFAQITDYSPLYQAIGMGVWLYVEAVGGELTAGAFFFPATPA